MCVYPSNVCLHHLQHQSVLLLLCSHSFTLHFINDHIFIDANDIHYYYYYYFQCILLNVVVYRVYVCVLVQ